MNDVTELSVVPTSRDSKTSITFGENTMTNTKQVEYDHINENELVKRVQSGDTEAFNPLILKYEKKIYNLIYKRVDNRETAQDLCQEVFLKAWRALPNFKNQSIFYTWIYKIAVNCCIDYIRKRNKQFIYVCEELPENPDDVFPILQTQLSPCEILEMEELGYVIRKTVHQLPPRQQRVFRLYYFHDLPIKEIAVRINKTESTIKAHLHQARRNLRNMLLPYLQNEPLAW